MWCMLLLSEHFNIWTDGVTRTHTHTHTHTHTRTHTHTHAHTHAHMHTHTPLYLLTSTIPHTSLSPPYLPPALKTSDGGSHCLLLCYILLTKTSKHWQDHQGRDTHLGMLTGSPRKKPTKHLSMLTGSLEKSPGEVWATHLYITYLHMYISILVYWLLWTEFMTHY